MKERFQDIAFRSSSLTIIEQADAILTEYQGRGFVLTLRQLYYQFVSRNRAGLEDVSENWDAVLAHLEDLTETNDDEDDNDDNDDS